MRLSFEIWDVTSRARLGIRVMGINGCIAKGSAETVSEGGNSSGYVSINWFLNKLLVGNCYLLHGHFLPDRPYFSFNPLTNGFLQQRSQELNEFRIDFADFDLGYVRYIGGREGEWINDRITERPVVSINSTWHWNDEGLIFQISGNCGFPKASVPELKGHKLGDSYEINAQIPWTSLTDLFDSGFVEAMKSRATGA